MGPVDHFDHEAKLVLAIAQGQAVRLKHPAIGPEHLLLALAQGEGRVAQALRASGVAGRQLWDEVQRTHASGDSAAFSEILLTVDSRTVFAQALKEAEQLDPSTVSARSPASGLDRELPGDGVRAELSKEQRRD